MTKGRSPKPNSIKKLTGNLGKRRINEFNPNVLTSIPAAPELVKESKCVQLWNDLSAVLIENGILTVMDLLALEFLVMDIQQYRDAQIEINKYGMIVKTDTGAVRRSPFLDIRDSAQDRIFKMLLEFGMSPAARKKIGVMLGMKNSSLAEKFFGAPVKGDEVV